jgi:hypothetical protein
MAYLKVAAKRFGDCVPMRITGALLRKFPAALYRETLRIMKREGLQLEDLMQEDADVAGRRAFLQHRTKCLKQARAKLTRLV